MCHIIFVQCAFYFYGVCIIQKFTRRERMLILMNFEFIIFSYVIINAFYYWLSHCELKFSNLDLFIHEVLSLYIEK